MRVALSPYHLTSREPPAMAALLLAHQVVTLLPAPFDAHDSASAQRAARRSPRYSDFMKSWSWSVPLWQRGILVSQLHGDDAAHDMRELAQRLIADERFLPLHSLMKHHLFDSEHDYLDAIGADLLKGGPDPGITVPLAAALDRFAARHQIFVARAAPTSVAQRAESKLARNVFAIAVPVLLQASADRLLFARDLLEPQLVALRRAISAIAHAPAHDMQDASESLSLAVAAYAQAFDREESQLTEPDDDEVRVIVGPAVLSAVAMPSDAVLRSSLDAVAIMARSKRPTTLGQPASLPVRSDEGDHAPVVSLIVRAMGTPPTSPRSRLVGWE
jgi:hypothetical protein